MNPSTTLSQQFTSLYFNTLTQTYSFLPRLLGSMLILLIGTFIAKWIKKIVIRSLELLKIETLIKNTPVEAFFKNAEFGQKFESIIGSLAYWLFMLLVFQTAVSTLGLSSLVYVLDRIVAYIPKVISAIIVLCVGVLLAGLVESLVKGSVRSFDGRHARLLGTVSSYFTLMIFVLAAILELGIAQQFIMILFIGMVTTVTIAIGLSIGLGSKDVVAQMMGQWYKRFKKDHPESL